MNTECSQNSQIIPTFLNTQFCMFYLRLMINSSSWFAVPYTEDESSKYCEAVVCVLSY